MKVKATSSNPVSSVVEAGTPHHFLLLAQDAEQLGDRLFAKHFLEIAMELFDAAPQATSITAPRRRPARQSAHQALV